MGIKPPHNALREFTLPAALLSLLALVLILPSLPSATSTIDEKTLAQYAASTVNQPSSFQPAPGSAEITALNYDKIYCKEGKCDAVGFLWDKLVWQITNRPVEFTQGVGSATWNRTAGFASTFADEFAKQQLGGDSPLPKGLAERGKYCVEHAGQGEAGDRCIAASYSLAFDIVSISDILKGGASLLKGGTAGEAAKASKFAAVKTGGEAFESTVKTLSKNVDELEKAGVAGTENWKKIINGVKKSEGQGAGWANGLEKQLTGLQGEVKTVKMLIEEGIPAKNIKINYQDDALKLAQQIDIAIVDEQGKVIEMLEVKTTGDIRNVAQKLERSQLPNYEETAKQLAGKNGIEPDITIVHVDKSKLPPVNAKTSTAFSTAGTIKIGTTIASAATSQKQQTKPAKQTATSATVAKPTWKFLYKGLDLSPGNAGVTVNSLLKPPQTSTQQISKDTTFTTAAKATSSGSGGGSSPSSSGGSSFSTYSVMKSNQFYSCNPQTTASQQSASKLQTSQPAGLARPASQYFSVLMFSLQATKSSGSTNYISAPARSGSSSPSSGSISSSSRSSSVSSSSSASVSRPSSSSSSSSPSRSSSSSSSSGSRSSSSGGRGGGSRR